MTAIQIIDELNTRGVILKVADDRLTVDAPKGLLTAKWREELSRLKTEIISILKSSALRTLRDRCSELQAVATLFRCPLCGSRLYQLTHPQDETDHYTACEKCDYHAITPTVLRGFCYGDECDEELKYINGQAYCPRHRMTITLIEQMQ